MKWNLKGIFFRLIPNINEHEASQNFTLHPLIATFGSGEATTSYWGRSKGDRLCIKVWDINSHNDSKRIYVPKIIKEPVAHPPSPFLIELAC